VKSAHALRRFEAFLRTRKLRVTEPRRQILLAAWATHEHFSAEDLYSQLRQAGSRASRATVYRTLGLLVEGGFLAALDGGQGQMLYEHILGHQHHDHMICLGCGKILEFRCGDIETLQEEQARQFGFRVVNHTLILEGYCALCQRKGKGSEPT